MIINRTPVIVAANARSLPQLNGRFTRMAVFSPRDYEEKSKFNYCSIHFENNIPCGTRFCGVTTDVLDNSRVCIYRYAEY